MSKTTTFLYINIKRLVSRGTNFAMNGTKDWEKEIEEERERAKTGKLMKRNNFNLLVIFILS